MIGFIFVIWNINLVCFCVFLVVEWVSQVDLDVLCLQEIKCQNYEFLEEVFCEMGFLYFYVCGQKGMYGVVIVLKFLLEDIGDEGLCLCEEVCYQCVMVEGVELYNFYILVGGDEFDLEINLCFVYKMEFFVWLEIYFWECCVENVLLVFVGDFNIVFYEYDVWLYK